MRFFQAILCLVLLTALPAQAREKVLDIQEVTSPGGIKAWLVEDHSIPVLDFQFAFKGSGAAQEPADQQGLSRMASNTMDEGAGDIDSQSFQKELRDKAISLAFSSGRDSFGGELKTLTKNKDRAFELLHLALTVPRFDAEPLERMRRANQSRVKSSMSDPDWIAARIENDVLFPGHPYAQNSGGTLTTLENITADDLRAFTKTLARDRLHVAVAGDITKNELAALLDKVFNGLPQTAPVTPVPDTAIGNRGKIFVYNYDIPQTIIEMTQPGIRRTDPDYNTAQVMNYILGSSGFGSRLMKEVREKRGLTYGIYTYFTDMDHAQSLSVSTSTKNETAAEILGLVKQEWDKMAASPVTDDELKSAKTYLTGSLPLSLTSTDDIASLILSLQMDGLPIDYLEKREDAIKAATATDVNRVAKRILDYDQFTTVMVGKPEHIQNAQTVETLPNVE